MAHKMRRIKGKMLEKFSDPKKMFYAMDKDGGGSLGKFYAPHKVKNHYISQDLERYSQFV